MFYQRNAMPLAEVAQGQLKARKQSDVIADFFRSRPSESFTPFEVAESLRLKCPITSIRRAMTDLTNEGVLVKDELNQRKGIYGMSNCTWRLINRMGEQAKLF